MIITGTIVLLTGMVHTGTIMLRDAMHMRGTGIFPFCPEHLFLYILEAIPIITTMVYFIAITVVSMNPYTLRSEFA